MVLEVVMLDVQPGREAEYEAAFAEARSILASAEGCISHALHRCIEAPNRYVLLVTWRHLLDHTEGFKQSPRHPDWKRLLHHFYDPRPVVQHFEAVTF